MRGLVGSFVQLVRTPINPANAEVVAVPIRTPVPPPERLAPFAVAPPLIGMVLNLGLGGVGTPASIDRRSTTNWANHFCPTTGTDIRELGRRGLLSPNPIPDQFGVDGLHRLATRLVPVLALLAIAFKHGSFSESGEPLFLPTT